MRRAQCVLVIALAVRMACSWDIAVSPGDQIEFYTIDGTKTDTVRFVSQNLTALAYDEVHNMLLYVDKQSGNDTICGYKISFLEYQCYIERNGRNIQGLAFDPVTEILFFTDTKERSINWLSFKSGFKNNVYGNLLIKIDEGIPTDLAVDSCRGYVYWINTNLTTSTIERARFDGSEREVVIYATYKLDLVSLAIDQQAKKIYWQSRKTSFHYYVDSADFDGKNRKSLIEQDASFGNIIPPDHTNSLAVTKESLMIVSRCLTCSPRTVYEFPIPLLSYDYKSIFQIDTESNLAIATNGKIKDQFQGISDCSHVLNNFVTTNDTSKIAKEYEGPFCVHGIKVRGQSICKCTPGYTGVRCEASVCDNYCFQGNCSFTEEGFPKCRCNAGYSGERCEVNVCNGYCLNNGTCSLSEEDEPVCECIGEYEGGRCEVPTGFNNGDGCLIEKIEPAYQTPGSRFKDEQNNDISSASKHYTAERNITLADLLANWQKPVATISVVVEVKTNN